jgi:hypothetical protein
MKSRPYFTLNDIVMLSMLAALVFALRIYLRIPMHLPGKSGIFWVVPIILGLGITGKPGSATYIGVLSGVLSALFGMGDNGVLEGINYVVMGIAIDAGGFFFRDRLDNVLVGVMLGALGNLAKMVSNSYLDVSMGVPAAYVMVGMTMTIGTHLLFGGIGGGIAAVLLGRLYKSGIVERYAKRSRH